VFPHRTGGFDSRPPVYESNLRAGISNRCPVTKAQKINEIRRPPRTGLEGMSSGTGTSRQKGDTTISEA
jgi:hypothetical protein